jgi:hypothetical protein
MKAVEQLFPIPRRHYQNDSGTMFKAKDKNNWKAKRSSICPSIAKKQAY